MNDFNTLKQMDIEEVHRKTRITLVRLRDILEKRFENIDPTRARGFIKILERELQLDLSEWLKEYEEYLHPYMQKEDVQGEVESKETKPLEQDSPNITQNEVPPKQNKQIKNKQQLNNMNIEINMPKQHFSYKTILGVMIFFIIVLLIVLGIYLVGSANTQEKQAVEQNNTQKQVVEKDISQTYPTISLYEAINDKESQRYKPSKKIQQESTVQTQQDLQDEAKEDFKKTEKTQNAQQTTLTITPKQDVWFAWVDTQTKARGEKYTKTPITLTISDKTAFHFGYAVLSIEVDGQTFEYNQRGVAYMLYDKTQGMKLITQKEYKALGGK